MSGTQENITKERAITGLVPEASIGAGGTPGRVWNLTSDADPECTTEEVEIPDIRRDEFDNPSPDFGLQSWKWEPSFHIRAVTTKLNSGASPSTPPNLKALKALLGGEWAAAGSAVVADPAPTASEFAVTATHGGTRFKVNQWINVPVNGIAYPVPIKAITDDLLTLAWELPDAPATGAVVYNMYNYFYDSPNIKSLYLEHLKTDSANLQWKLFGGTGEFSWSGEYGKLLTYKAALTGPKYEEGALSLTNSYSADTQGGPFNFSQGDCFVLDPSSDTATKTTVTKITFKPKTGNVHLPEVTNTGAGGKSGIFRGDVRMPGDVEIQTPYDPAWRTTWAARPQLRLGFTLSRGSGTSKQFACWHYPRAIIVGQPRIIPDGNQNPLYHAFTLRAQIDPTGADKYAKNPMFFAVG